ncbi:MAG TPA: hypothetical protein DHV36_07370 [Desulfobacteraceae bacterium]|nr:hypothetical protein [Desulfobacteraceae bacterium]
MNLSAILGLLGTLIGLIRALPQLMGLIRTGRANGVSPDSAATSAIVSFGWAAYGVLTSQYFVTLATGASGAVFLAITFCALHHGRRVREIKVAPVWFSVLILAFILRKETGLGLVLPVSILVSNIPQLYVAFKEDNLSDLSLGTWLLSVSDGIVWGSYAIIEQDTAIMVFGIFQLITSGAIVLLKLIKDKKYKARVRIP